MAGFDNQAQIRRKGTLVSGTSCLLIGVWRGQVVRKLSGPLEHLSLIVRAVLVFDFLCHGLNFVGSVRDTYEVTPGNAVERMTSGADLAVDLVSTANAKEGLRINGVRRTSGGDLT